MKVIDRTFLSVETLCQFLYELWTYDTGSTVLRTFLAHALRSSLTLSFRLCEDGVAQSVEHRTANLATPVRSPVGEEPSDLVCAFLHVQMESNWAGLSVCICRHTGKWCGTIKAVGNTDHTRQTWIHMQTPLSPLAGCGPVGEGTSGKVLNWTVRSLNHAYTTTIVPFVKLYNNLAFYNFHISMAGILCTICSASVGYILHTHKIVGSEKEGGGVWGFYPQRTFAELC